MFSADFVLDVLDCIPDAIVDGGWGIDALIGRVTREHDDLDLVIPKARADAVAGVLRPLGLRSRVVPRPRSTRRPLARCGTARGRPRTRGSCHSRFSTRWIWARRTRI